MAVWAVSVVVRGIRSKKEFFAKGCLQSALHGVTHHEQDDDGCAQVDVQRYRQTVSASKRA